MGRGSSKAEQKRAQENRFKKANELKRAVTRTKSNYTRKRNDYLKAAGAVTMMDWGGQPAGKSNPRYADYQKRVKARNKAYRELMKATRERDRAQSRLNAFARANERRYKKMYGEDANAPF